MHLYNKICSYSYRTEESKVLCLIQTIFYATQATWLQNSLMYIMVKDLMVSETLIITVIKVPYLFGTKRGFFLPAKTIQEIYVSFKHSIV